MQETLIHTDRLELKPTHPTMVDEMWAAIQASATELAQWMPWAVKPDVEDTKAFLHRAADAWDSGRDRQFSIFKDGVLCGQCSLDHVDPLHRSAEIGYWMRSDLCGQGFMTEAASAVIRYGFGTEAFHRIELHAGTTNAASIRVAEKLGFQREGLLRHAGYAATGFFDCYVYGLLVTDPRPDVDTPANSQTE